MLIVIILSFLFIVGMILAILDSKFWDTEIIGMVGITLGVIHGIILFIVLVSIIFVRIDVPSLQAKIEEKYYSLLQKVEHIDSYNREEVKELVNQWNYNYRTYNYGHQSPWTNWFYPCNLETVNLIELEWSDIK